MSENSITFSCITVPRLNNLQRLLPKVIPFVDRVIVTLGREDAEVVSYLHSLGPKVLTVFRKWDDNFANQYNVYLDHVNQGWVLIMDDDEVPSDAMLASLREYVANSDNGRKYSCVSFRANPISEGQDLGPANYWRQVFFKYVPGMKYRGGTNTGCHQYLVGYQNNNIINSDNTYYHIKSLREEYQHAARNYFIYGIWRHGSTDGVQTEEWRELKRVLKSTYPGVETFQELDDILVQGNIAEPLKQWMRDSYTKYETHKDYNECRAFTLYYTKYLFPTEKVLESV